MRTDDTVSKRPNLLDGELEAHRTGQRLTPERLTEHLNGGPVRGCYVMSPGTTTMVGVLDLDSHRGETPWDVMVSVAWDLMESLRLLGAAPIAFRSGGGRGVHLYVLWDEPQDAYAVRQWFLAVLRSCGYVEGAGGIAAGQVEIFPKRDHVEVGKYGAQVFLPLGGQSVPLAWDDLLGELVPMPREWVLEWHGWPMSPGVPAAEKPARAERASIGMLEGLEMGEALQALRAPLQAIADAIVTGKREPMRHDPWRALVQALHRVSGGGEDGRALAHWFSAAIPLYDAQRLDQVWDTSDAAREDGVGAGTVLRIAREYGWIEPLDESWAEDISGEDNHPPILRRSREGDLPHVGPPLPPAGAGTGPGVRRRGIPEANYLTTDQANANRIKDAYGTHVMVVSGRWYVWDGRRWTLDEGDVYRFTCRLSQIVSDEAKEWAAKAAKADAEGDGAKAKDLGAVAKALRSWALKCEMRSTIEAAVGLLKKMLTVEIETLDRNPWALNVANGIVDLRTGALRPHDPAEYHTKLVDVAYRPDAAAPTWERVLVEIAGGGSRGEELAGFLRRWFGYCLTGDTREQCFVVHWGGGSNGKSTVLGLMAQTMGEYAATAAPGLLVGSRGDRHPTEIAALAGRRMVTTHESGDGALLKEDFIKQATGGDRLVGRWMHENFFEFEPTHKLQLLTNHKPQVKSQDEGIWRRVLLVPYVVSFGSAEEVAAGRRDRLKDTGLAVALGGELEGVLAWRVRGAVEWANGGLEAPESVKSASRAYRVEQDRVGAFVHECCEVGAGCEEALTDRMGGLYPAYVEWVKESGLMPLSKSRFLDEILRVVPEARTQDRKVGNSRESQRRLKIICGLKVLND
jgi:P4 family phage/plasmid primase-like protien